MKKYEITDIAHPQNPALHRIRAMADLNEKVKTGAIGGYVESEDNLSQEGSCWIYDDAVAREEAFVAQDAALRGKAVACGSAFVGGHADVAGAAVIRDCAIVLAGSVFENACICGDGKIMAGKHRGLDSRIFGSARIYGTISGNVICCSDTVIPPGMELINPTRDQFTLNGKGICIQPFQETGATHKPKRHEPER